MKKIEIDLNDIFGDENGAETLQDSVHRQVVERLTQIIRDGIGRRIDEAISSVLDTEMTKAVREQMPRLVDDLMNAEYVPVDRWGDRSGKTTFRRELIKAIHAQMEYKPEPYSDKENAFTRSVKAVVSAETGKFQREYNSKIDAEFVADAMKHATDKLAERLGLKTK